MKIGTEMKNPFSCPQCDWTFANFVELKIHKIGIEMKNHSVALNVTHNSQILNLAELKIHENWHYNEKPIVTVALNVTRNLQALMN